jgi:glutamyl-tRNA reductase
MQVVTVGLDCKKAPVEIREKLSFVKELKAEALTQLLALPHLVEAAILSTCNRVELYIVTQHISISETCTQLRHFLSHFHKVPEAQFADYLFYHHGQASAQHLFEVASGIQSMIVGEAQIQGQVRDAIDFARQHGSAGRVLDALFRAAIATGKRARTETAISANGVSVSFTAVELLTEKLGLLEGKVAAVIGSGDTARLAAQIMLDEKVSKLLIINRTPEKAIELAHRLHIDPANVYSFDQMVEALAQADVAVGCTGASHAVLKPEHVRSALAHRPERVLGLVDIAVPRDFEPEIKTVAGAQLWDIDDVKELAHANLARRSEEVKHVREIICEELVDFMAWMGALSVVPTIANLRQHAHTIRQNELARFRNSFGDLSAKQVALLDELTNRIVNKILHEPTQRLKEAASHSDAGYYAEVVQHLFSLQGVKNASN